MSILLQLKSVAVSLGGTLFRTKLMADMTAIENEVNNLDVVVSGLTANVTETWVPNTNYTVGKHVRSPLNFQTYRRLIEGAGTTDPSLDATNWTPAGVSPGQIQGASLTAFATGGTGTAFTLTPTPAISAYAANQTWDVIFNVACGANPTFAVSGLANPPNLVKQNLDGTYTNLAANDFPAGWQSRVKLISPTQALVMSILGQSSGAVTLTLTGCTTSPTIDFKYVKIGKVVTLSPNADSITGTSNLTSKTLTGLPSWLAPSVSYYDHGLSIDNGGPATIAAVRISSNGTITLQPSTSIAAWTPSGLMALYPKSYTYITAQ